MRIPATLAAIAALSGCAVFDQQANVLSADVHTDPLTCSSQLVGSNRPTYAELDSADIQLVNWNIQRGGDDQWLNDLQAVHGKPDLVALQEAPAPSNSWDIGAASQHHSFSPGYRTRRWLTGVMTVSTAEPLTQCNFMNVEPWIRSPKATVVTEYGLTNSDQTLLVVNMHVVNFTFGIHDFREQIQQALSVLSNHTGPVLLSGDFNTWHRRRAAILKEMTAEQNLRMVDFDEDHRKRFLGQPLDHVYIRGLEVLEATTRTVDSSDHNPMSVRLRTMSRQSPTMVAD